MEMCKIIHPSKMSDESYKVFRELLPIMYKEASGEVLFLEEAEVLPNSLSRTKIPVILVDQKIPYFNKIYYRLPVDNGIVYKDGERISVWVLRECLAI